MVISRVLRPYESKPDRVLLSLVEVIAGHLLLKCIVRTVHDISRSLVKHAFYILNFSVCRTKSAFQSLHETDATQAFPLFL